MTGWKVGLPGERFAFPGERFAFRVEGGAFGEANYYYKSASMLVFPYFLGAKKVLGYAGNDDSAHIFMKSEREGLTGNERLLASNTRRDLTVTRD